MIHVANTKIEKKTHWSAVIRRGASATKLSTNSNSEQLDASTPKKLVAKAMNASKKTISFKVKEKPRSMAVVPEDLDAVESLFHSDVKNTPETQVTGGSALSTRHNTFNVCIKAVTPPFSEPRGIYSPSRGHRQSAVRSRSAVSRERRTVVAPVSDNSKLLTGSGSGPFRLQHALRKRNTLGSKSPVYLPYGDDACSLDLPESRCGHSYVERPAPDSRTDDSRTDGAPRPLDSQSRASNLPLLTAVANPRMSEHSSRLQGYSELVLQPSGRSALTKVKTVARRIVSVGQHCALPPPPLQTAYSKTTGAKVTVIDWDLKVFVVDLVQPEVCDFFRDCTDLHVHGLETSEQHELSWRPLYTYTKMDIPCCEVPGVLPNMHGIVLKVLDVLGDVFDNPHDTAKLHARSWKEPHFLVYQKVKGKM